MGALGGGLASVPSGVWELAGIQSMTCPFRVRVVATMLGFGGRSVPPGPHGSELAFARLISAESFVALHPSPATTTPMSATSRGSPSIETPALEEIATPGANLMQVGHPGARERLRCARSIEARTRGIAISLQLKACSRSSCPRTGRPGLRQRKPHDAAYLVLRAKS